MLTLDIDIESPWPTAGDWDTLAHRAASATAQIAHELRNSRLSASLLLSGDAEVRGLNREWRGKDAATNVLSFPMLERGELLALTNDGPPELLGDIVLAYETCAREAAEKGIPVKAHAVHLIVHGLLHLAGYDHETSPDAAAVMEDLEIKALASLGLGNPYECELSSDGATG
jgi:probable rRNA maturation factor